MTSTTTTTTTSTTTTTTTTTTSTTTTTTHHYHYFYYYNKLLLHQAIINNCPSTYISVSGICLQFNSNFNPLGGTNAKIDTNVPLSTYTAMGYTAVYEVTYATITVTSDLATVYNGCTAASMICVGGYDSLAPATLISVACGNCQSILGSQTTKNSPLLVDGIYWYYLVGSSFGYSPSSLINQDIADRQDTVCDQRLSWHLNSLHGGWRIGGITLLNFDTRYYKLILRK